MKNMTNTTKKPRRMSLTMLIVSAVCFFGGIFIFIVLTLIMGAIAPIENALLAIAMIVVVFLSFDIAFLGFMGMAICGIIELINMSKKPQGMPAAAPADIAAAPLPETEAHPEPESITGTETVSEADTAPEADPVADAEPKALSGSDSAAPAGKKPKKKLPVQLVIIMVLMGLQGLCGAAWVVFWFIGMISQMSLHTEITEMPYYLPVISIIIGLNALFAFGEIGCAVWLVIANFARKK